MLWMGTFHRLSHFLARDCCLQGHCNTSTAQPQVWTLGSGCSVITRENFRFWFLLKKTTIQQNQQDSSSQFATEMMKRKCPGGLKTLWRHPRNDRLFSGDTGTPTQAVGWG